MNRFMYELIDESMDRYVVKARMNGRMDGWLVG